MFILEILGTIATIIAVAGVVLNNHKCRWCFVLWMMSNTLFVVVHVIIGVWSLMVRDIIFLGLAVHGYWLWR